MASNCDFSSYWLSLLLKVWISPSGTLKARANASECVLAISKPAGLSWFCRLHAKKPATNIADVMLTKYQSCWSRKSMGSAFHSHCKLNANAFLFWSNSCWCQSTSSFSISCVLTSSSMACSHPREPIQRYVLAQSSAHTMIMIMEWTMGTRGEAVLGFMPAFFLHCEFSC